MARRVAAAGAEAKRLNVPLIVHATGLREAKAALAAGAALLVHGVGDLEVDDAFLQKAKSQGTIYCPTLTVFEGYRRLAAASAEKKAPEVDDPGGCVDPQTLEKLKTTASLPAPGFDPARLSAFSERVRKELAVGSANLKKVRDAGIPIAMGTDAGNPLTLHGASVFAEMEAMQAAGMSAMEVLMAATREGARAMGKLDRWGTVEAGKEADLVVLDADPSQDIRNFRKIRYVVKGGVVRSRDELRPAPPEP
jgi:imidazolonepropionase-like amidohydrolase